MFNVVRMQLKLAVPPARVFAALTDPSALEAWFCEHAAISAEAYNFWGRFTPEAPAEPAGHHPLLTYTPDRALSYEWRLRGALTTVHIQLAAHAGGTRLTLLQTATAVTAPYHLEDFWFLSLENLRRYLDGKTCEARIDFSRPMKGDIRHELLTEASPQQVFEAIVRPEQLEIWLATRATIEPEPGGTFELGWGEQPMGIKIIEIVPNEKIALSLPEDPVHGNPNRSATVVSWILEASGGKTRITFVHSGFAADEDVSGIYTGWLSFLNWLRSVAEYGIGWQPPLVVLSPHSIAYAGSIHRAQGEIDPELARTMAP